MIQAIVMDIGGVLLRTEERSGRQALEKKYRLPAGGVEALVFNSKVAYESTIGKVKPEKIWQEVASELRLTQTEIADFKQAFWQGDQIDQTLISFLENQRPRYTTALLTNAWMDARQALAKKYEIIEGNTVDHILISSELGVAKPDQRIFQILAKTINYQFDQILFIDDFIENIEAAKNLGVQTIHYQPGMNLITLIEGLLEQD